MSINWQSIPPNLWHGFANNVRVATVQKTSAKQYLVRLYPDGGNVPLSPGTYTLTFDLAKAQAEQTLIHLDEIEDEENEQALRILDGLQ